ncbi:hypothetical protein GPL21_39190 [Bradyrhizobium pachyrhizi]|uniref:Uncharacterized protein n=1 Tax=Bradyrhizobium pachyrhizi TaxID=280333 RepID=A0A844T8X0_9BRAD|nr:hypothetical protein [Bradyrhizobium pachyrhizi]MVT71070.1 hypothetical protein [Bradyrhizobium pachyrhizi]
MPVLECGDHLTDLGRYQTTIELISIMAWPSDEALRKQFTASVMSKNLGQLQLLEGNLPDPRSATNWVETIEAVHDHEEWMHAAGLIENWFLDAGGYSSVAEAEGLKNLEKVIASREKEWLSAGLILALVRRMAEHHSDDIGASLNRAFHIIETVEIPLTIRNKRDLQKAWKAYRPVAHFCAALFDRIIKLAAKSSDIGPDDDPLNDMMSFLGEAEAYLNFGTSYEMPLAKNRETLLDPNNVWEIPDDAALISTALISEPLSGELLSAARSYRAPVPSQ